MTKKSGTEEQRIHRGNPSKNFAVFPNRMWEDPRLSIASKGLLGYIGSRPPRWSVRLKHLAKTLNIGRDRLRSMIRELITAGYVRREQARKGTRFGPMDYWVYTESQGDVAFLSRTGFPATGFPATENPSAYKERDSAKKDSYQATVSSNPLPQNAAEAAQSKGLGNGKPRRLNRSQAQASLADRVGLGNEQAGWLILGELSETELDHLTMREQQGRVDNAALRRIAERVRERVLTRTAQ